MSFHVFYINGAACIDLKNGEMIEIGSVQDVKNANANEIANMIEISLAFYEFNHIEHDIRLTLH